MPIPAADLRADRQVAFVPGGYGGIGAAIAWGWRKHGARGDRRGPQTPARPTRMAAQMRDRGSSRRAGVAMDAHSVASIRAAVDAAAAMHCGRLDILMNCVGIQREEPLLDVTEEAFDEVYEVNLKAAMFLGAGGRATSGRWRHAAAAMCICCRCERSSACAIAATPRTAAPRAGS